MLESDAMKPEQIILASNSPRRKQLLSLLGWSFDVIPADIDESQRPGEPPCTYVRRLACEKAQAVAGQDGFDGVVVAADTIVVDNVNDELLGKPADADEAKRMLRRLRGRVHHVYTGLALVDGVRSLDDLCRTEVPMRHYTDAEIERYVASGDPMDKAGAYAIQHAGFRPVSNLSGCFASVMGFPLCHLKRALQQLGYQAADDLPKRCQAFLDYDCPVYQAILGIS